MRCGLSFVLLAATAGQSYARQNPETGRERERLEGELKRYHGVINAYSKGDDAQVEEGMAHDHGQLHAALNQAEPAGATSLHDVAYAALTLKDDQPGRSLVLLFSDGHDTVSWLPGQFVIEAARRSAAVVYAVGLMSAIVPAPGYRLDFRSGVQPPVPGVVPSALSEPFLQSLAEETGGTFLTTDRSDRLRDTFVQIVNEFRTRYLLTYTPRGVDAGGWHPIDVKLKGRRGTVTARRGYLK